MRLSEVIAQKLVERTPPFDGLELCLHLGISRIERVGLDTLLGRDD